MNYKKTKGTILLVAPFFNRSGYGVTARASATIMYNAGYNIRILSVDEFEEGIDDFDTLLLKSLQDTPLIPPITAVFTHVPNKLWANMLLPEPNVRILETTFDSSAQGNFPPKEWVDVCKKMDQIWLQTESEIRIFNKAGVDKNKLKLVRSPHPWKENALIPAITLKKLQITKPFRFLSIAMFLPRRRWDILIEAFLMEFNNNNVELFLKVNYPTWHPIPDKPQKDLHGLIQRLKLKTRSKAKIIVDEQLGTRQTIIELIDSCSAYISTDTSSTAPVGEAWARKRVTIIPKGLVTIPEKCYFIIDVDENAKFELTKEMLQYQPHHSKAFMHKLFVNDVRKALKEAFNSSDTDENNKVDEAYKYIVENDVSLMDKKNAISDAWKVKSNELNINEPNRKHILWEGKVDSKSSLAKVNYEMLNKLNPHVENLTILSDDNISQFSEQIINYEEYIKNSPEVGIHLRHEFPPNLTPPPNGRWVIIQPWEFGSLPKEWVDVFAKDVDEMWVPSNYVKKCYTDSGIPEERVFVVPNGFNPDVCNNKSAEIKLKTKKKFKFLFVGGTIYRKGIDLLLKAYSESFSANDDVCLVIKDMGGNSFYDGQTYIDQINEIINDENAPKIECIDKFLSEDELKGLYQSADILVHPYRGEGFGLPILESMACGTPVIVTNGGAALDFCNAENSFLVDAEKTFYKEKKVGELETVNHPWLYEVSVKNLTSVMKSCCENSEEIERKGKLAYESVHSNFTWAKSAEIIKEQIEILSMKPIVRLESAKKEKAILFSNYIDNTFKFIDEKKYQEALNNLTLAIENYNSNENNSNEIKLDELLIVKGNLCIAINDLVEAKETFEAALNENPNSSQACQGLGEIFEQAEEYEAAKMMFEWAVKNDETNKIALQKLATLNISLGLDENDFSLSEET